jgi:hypothetical protein
MQRPREGSYDTWSAQNILGRVTTMLLNTKEKVSGAVARPRTWRGSRCNLNEVMSNLKALGFSVSRFQVGMGLDSEIGARLTARSPPWTRRRSEDDRRSPGGQDPVAVLEALRTTQCSKSSSGIWAEGVEADVTPGLPPRVSVRLMNGLDESGAWDGRSCPSAGLEGSDAGEASAEQRPSAVSDRTLP